MSQCVSGLTRWGDKKKGGWRDQKGDEEDEESMPMLSQVRSTGL